MPALLHHFRQRLQYVLRLPTQGYIRPHILYTNHLLHLVETWITRYTVIIWHLVIVRCGDLITGYTTSRHLPQHQSESVHIGHFMRFKFADVDGAVKDFRGHVSTGPTTCTQKVSAYGVVQLVAVTEVLHGETEIGNATLQVGLHQDVLTFDVSVGYCRLTCKKYKS